MKTQPTIRIVESPYGGVRILTAGGLFGPEPQARDFDRSTMEGREGWMQFALRKQALHRAQLSREFGRGARGGAPASR